MASRAINVQISLKYSELKTTHNTFRDCRVAVYRRFRESATQAIIFQSSDLFHFDNVLKAEHLRCVKISSGSREGARPPPPPPPPPPSIIFRPNWGPKGQKNFFEIPPAPPYLRVWKNGGGPPI